MTSEKRLKIGTGLTFATGLFVFWSPAFMPVRGSSTSPAPPERQLP